jgi:hypothetical protein
MKKLSSNTGKDLHLDDKNQYVENPQDSPRENSKEFILAKKLNATRKRITSRNLEQINPIEQSPG